MMMSVHHNMRLDVCRCTTLAGAEADPQMVS